MKRIAILCSLCLVLFLSGARAQTQTQSQPAGQPKLVIDQETYDAGEIYKSGKNLDHVFTVKNTGSAELKILSATPG